MTNILRLIFEHRSCIKKLKILIHPDKRPNDQLVAEDEWKQLDTYLTNLSGYPSWRSLSNWQDFQYVSENINEFKEQQTSILSGALSICAMVEYLNAELELTPLVYRFESDFKSRYSSLSAKQVDDIIKQICHDLRLMNDNINYQPCAIASVSMVIEEQIVVNDNKFWKQLMCQKLDIKLDQYSNHFIVDWLQKNKKDEYETESNMEFLSLDGHKHVDTQEFSQGPLFEVDDDNELRDTAADKLFSKPIVNVSTDYQLNDSINNIIDDEGIVGPQVFDETRSEITNCKVSVLEEPKRKKKKTFLNSAKSKKRKANEHECNNLCKKSDKTLTLRRFVPHGNCASNNICYKSILEYLKTKPNTWEPRQNIVDHLMIKKDVKQLQPLKCLFTKLYQEHCCFTNVTDTSPGLLMMGREIGKQRRLFFRFNE
jgi:hypothetical protein